MTVLAKVHREYLGIVIAQLRKANGVKILTGIHPDAQIQSLCITSRLKDDLLHILKKIDAMGYLCFEYKVCGK